MRTPDVEGSHGGEDLFRGFFTGFEDATDLSEASSLFDEAQRILSRALALHQEGFSKSLVELSRCEADLQRLTEERNFLKLLNGQKEEEIKDLRAKLAMAHKEQTELIEQVQQKAERIEQLLEEGNMMKAKTLGWKQNMDRLASEEEAAQDQLLAAESQLQDVKEKSSAQAKKIEDLEARLATELVKAKSEAKNVKADEEAIVAETLEEIHARGYDLTDEIRKAKELEDDAKAFSSSDGDDDDKSKRGSESGEDPGEEEATFENS
ncbi:PREDICTED: centrosomal protein of 290 kDa-like [Nicotiana attenuata]|uniref:centrosomal protein of 290 kDa-like n=1 Tax=Nicotiana attenuata TaxID=49451 RepID=UPI000904F61A|nr:PREDICTED: centrosomal protein of 290 kDa-like [Nicotiana attenuata]